MPTQASRPTTSFLPDFCSARMVFAVVLLAELFALVLSLAAATPGALTAEALRISLFVQWNALCGAAALCALRGPLSRFSDIGAAVIGYLTLLLMTLLLSEAALLLHGITGASLVRSDAPLFILRNLAVAAVVSALALRYFYIQKQWRERTRAEASARIDALQARIRPHFLFNSMNTIASLIRDRPATAETAVEDLAELFRASMADHRLTTLRDELELTRRYLAMEQLRLGDRLTVDWSVTAPDDGLLPPLSIQPLVENAIYHGVERQTAGGTVRVEAHLRRKRLEITVCNPAAPANESKGNRLALENVRQRLQAHYGRRAALDTESLGHTHVARLRVPYRSADERSDRGR